MAIIESYRHEGDGYEPFLVREDWQVAQLNHMAEQDLYGIAKMDRHLLTDEVFILLKGVAVLIAADVQEGGFEFEAVRMRAGITYNIPCGAWHNIAMREGAELIIVERSGTHTGDFELRKLTGEEKARLDALIKTIA